MSGLIPVNIRQIVTERAKDKCEYCQFPQAEAFYTYHVEHVRSLKHGGSDDLDNLALSCPLCNRYKGSDIATIVDDTETLIRLFHPRRDSWNDHFEWREVEIIPLTKVGTATVLLLKLNFVDRLIERQRLKQ